MVHGKVYGPDMIMYNRPHATPTRSLAPTAPPASLLWLLLSPPLAAVIVVETHRYC